MTRCLCPHVRAGSCEWLNCLSDFFHDQQTAKEPSACFAFSRWSACVHSEKEQVKPRVFLFFILPPKKRPGSGSPSAGGNPGDDVFGRACGTVSVLRPFWSVRPSVCRWHSFPLISVVQFFPSLQQTFLPFSSFFSTWLQVLASILGALGALHTSQTINWVAALNQTIGSKRPNQNGPSAKKKKQMHEMPSTFLFVGHKMFVAFISQWNWGRSIFSPFFHTNETSFLSGEEWNGAFQDATCSLCTRCATHKCYSIHYILPQCGNVAFIKWRMLILISVHLAGISFWKMKLGGYPLLWRKCENLVDASALSILLRELKGMRVVKRELAATETTAVLATRRCRWRVNPVTRKKIIRRIIQKAKMKRCLYGGFACCLGARYLGCCFRLLAAHLRLWLNCTSH